MHDGQGEDLNSCLDHHRFDINQLRDHHNSLKEDYQELEAEAAVLRICLSHMQDQLCHCADCHIPPISAVGSPDTGGRGGITQGVSFEFFESFLLIYSHNTHWVNFEFFQKLLTTLIKTYSLGNF